MISSQTSSNSSIVAVFFLLIFAFFIALIFAVINLIISLILSFRQTSLTTNDFYSQVKDLMSVETVDLQFA